MLKHIRNSVQNIFYNEMKKKENMVKWLVKKHNFL